MSGPKPKVWKHAHDAVQAVYDFAGRDAVASAALHIADLVTAPISQCGLGLTPKQSDRLLAIQMFWRSCAWTGSVEDWVRALPCDDLDRLKCLLWELERAFGE